MIHDAYSIVPPERQVPIVFGLRTFPIDCHLNTCFPVSAAWGGWGDTASLEEVTKGGP